jgi:hypothetical protein
MAAMEGVNGDRTRVDMMDRRLGEQIIWHMATIGQNE